MTQNTPKITYHDEELINQVGVITIFIMYKTTLPVLFRINKFITNNYEKAWNIREGDKNGKGYYL
jgi:hypothetical protein